MQYPIIHIGGRRMHRPYEDFGAAGESGLVAAGESGLVDVGESGLVDAGESGLVTELSAGAHQTRPYPGACQSFCLHGGKPGGGT